MGVVDRENQRAALRGDQPSGIGKGPPGLRSRRIGAQSQPKRTREPFVERMTVAGCLDSGHSQARRFRLLQSPRQRNRLADARLAANDRPALARPNRIDEPGYSLVVGGRGDVTSARGRKWISDEVPVAQPHGQALRVHAHRETWAIDRVLSLGSVRSVPQHQTIALGGGLVADRFYAPGPWTEGKAQLEGDEARHLARVRRVESGELVTLFDGRGRSATAEVIAIARDRVSLSIVEEGDLDRSLAGPLVLATAVPKGDRFDWLVEKATELGVSRLVPLVTSRSVVDPRSSKLDRLRRLIIEASKQSGRSRLMDLGPPITWAEWLRHGSTGIETVFLAHPSGDRLIEASKPDFSRGIGFAIGPEGGFSDMEVEEAREAGHRVIALGPTILRVETAALAACVAVLTWAQ